MRSGDGLDRGSVSTHRVLTGGLGATVFDDEGRSLIDLASGNGTTFLGHDHPRVRETVQSAFESAWNAGPQISHRYSQACAHIDRWFPPSYTVAGLYSTGMESAEFAIRMAAEATQRSFIIGFEGSMHGKSLATAALGWPRTHVQAPNGWVRLPLVESSKEDALLNHLKEHLQTHRFAAVFVEPILGSAKGLRFTHGFLREVCALAASNGTLVIVDEILSGFYRAGEPFQFAAANVTPDIVLIGKAIGNGFPVSAVVARRDFHITPAMLPNSTYSGNPLACAAIVGTLEAMSELDMPGLTNRIQETIRSQLQPLTGQGWGVRGSGALWFVFPQHPNDMARRVNELWRRGVCVSYTRNFLRVMPSVLIEVDRLRSACHEVCDVLSTHK